MDLIPRLLPLALACGFAGFLAAPAMAASPTLTTFSVLSGNLEDTPTSVSLADLRAAGDEADADGGAPLDFKLKAILAGSLNASINDILTSGSWTWTPPANAFGEIAAFQLVAYDGANESTPPVTVTINVPAVNDAPSFTQGGTVTRNEDAGAISVANWATNILAGPPNESAQTVSFSVTSNTNSALFSVQPAVSPSGTLTFTSAPNANGSASIQLTLTDSGGTANGGINTFSPALPFTITILPVNDAPVLAGSIGGPQGSPYPDSAGVDGGVAASQALFNAVTVSDVDDFNPVAESITLTLTLSRDLDLYGTLSTPPTNASLTTTAQSHTYILANRSPAQAQADLRAARFTPHSNAHPVGLYHFLVNIAARDIANAQATALEADVYVQSVNDAPVVTASVSPASIPDGATVSPFRLTLSDPDVGETFSVTITETTAVPLGVIGGSGNSVTVTGTLAQISQLVQNITYTPNPQTLPSQSATFQVSVTDIHPDATTGTPVVQTVSLTVTFTNGAPEITGVTTEPIHTTDDPLAPVVLPFSGVTISDANASQILTVTLALDNPAKGSLAGTGLTAGNQLVGTAAQVTTQIRALVFQPVANRLAVNQQETVNFTITVDDGLVTRSNNLTNVVITYVNGAPVVNWAPGVQGAFPSDANPAQISPSPQALPFAHVEISDEGDVVVTVSIDNTAKGFLTSPGDAFITVSPGVLRFTGSHPAAQNAIRALVFVANPAYPFPAGQPGRTNFTIVASDSVLNQTSRVLPIVLISEARNFLVTSTLDSLITPGFNGTPGTLRHAIHAAAANDVITFALPSYPATIRLAKANGPLIINKHLAFKGPGPDKLTLSGDANSNGATDANDVQIFQIFATVSIEGIRLARGFAATGGAILVSSSQPGVAAGSLRLANCQVSDCVAAQWGGGIDVIGGSLTVENSLFLRNSVSVSSGQGGGAVSLYTHAACSFTNTTFSANQQLSPNGYGGGAIFVENDTPVSVFPTQITHCTFAANTDARNQGSSIHSYVSNSSVRVANSIFADFSARNLYLEGSGEILTQGGNVSNDFTTTPYIVGGVPQQFIILHHASDLTGEDPQLNPLANVGGETQGHSLQPTSIAAGRGIAGLTPIDQRGVVRNASIDPGALDADAAGRILIHEIAASQTTSGDFIEFYNPRNQATLNLTNYEIWINGLKIRTLTDPLLVAPGFGFILGSSSVIPLNANTPVIPVNPASPATPLALQPRGVIELRQPGGLKTIQSVSYVAVFANKDTPSSSDDYEPDSITLAPQFGGNALVPHRLVQSPPNGGVLLGGLADATSPGADTGGTPFGEANAYPIAILDRFEITEDELASLDVLANDMDADGSDTLFIVDVNTEENPAVPTNSATALSLSGAPVSVDPIATPLRGTRIHFDPRVSFNHLPQGARVTDFFAYSVIDIGGGTIAAFADDGGTATRVTAPAHRLTAGATLTISGCAIAAYNGSHVISSADADSFVIPVPFTADAAAGFHGSWLADTPRVPTQRDTARVEVTILGRNDPPTPMADTVATAEDTILRILGDPTLVGSAATFDTDASYPQPRQLSSIGILANDSDPDSDGMPYTQLRVVGVCQASPISGYAPNPAGSQVSVTAAGHGLTQDTLILISGYGGHPSYNGYHTATVTGPNTFTLPITFIDDAAPKGLWATLNDATRLSTTSSLGAAVTLEIRANRAQTNIVYNPRVSSFIDGLAIGQAATDTFYYAIEDTHGAVSLAQISVNLTGTNDAPVPAHDPSGLAGLLPLLPQGTSLANFIYGSQIVNIRPSAMPAANSVAIVPPGGDAATAAESILLENVRHTDEDSAISFTSASLLENDSDVDRDDVLVVEIAAGQALSRRGAAVTLTSGGAAVSYDPSNSGELQSLARNETTLDTFEITLFDGTARVTSLVAVLVTGLNDTPIASADLVTTPEDTLLELSAPGLLANDVEIDQNTSLPDDRKFLLPTEDAATTVFGAKVNINVDLREGTIDSFSAVAAMPAVTRVNAAAHGIESGQEVVITGAGTLTGQFVATALDTNTFTIPVPHDPSFATLGGQWSVLNSAFSYDPRASLSTLDPADSTFTLQGLATGQSYNDSFTYTVLDGSFLFANDDIYRIEADRSQIELKVLLNDTNLEGLATSRHIIAVGPPSAGGSVTLNGDQSLIYTPQTGFVGDEIFTYTIRDSLGQRASATVTARVTLNRLNGNIQANDDVFTVAAGQSPLLDVLANDDAIPATGTPLTLENIASAPDQGGSVVIEAGQLRYTPDPAAVIFPYTEMFAYTVAGGGSATSVATVEVRVVNRAGTLNVRADAFTIPANSSANPLEVLANDNILPGTGATLEITALGNPLHGSAVLSENAILYTPAAGFLGTDTFDYSVADGFGGTGTATITVTIGHLVTNSDFFAVLFDNPSIATDDGVTLLDVLANDGVLQAGGGDVTITSVTPTNPPLGAMTVTPGNQSLTFDPAPKQTGQQEFTYTIADASGRTASSTVTVVIVSQGVRANSDFFTVQTDSSANTLPVLTNDLRISSIPGLLAIASIGSGPNAPNQGGAVDISADLESLVYTPAPGFNGVETFTYTVTDGETSDTARVSIRSTNGELVAAADSFFAFRGSEDNSLNVLTNDRVIPSNGDILTITATDLDAPNPNPAFRGSLTIAEGGNGLIYTPAPENETYPYVETFTYEISDGGTRRSQAIVSIEVIDRIGARDLDTHNDAFTVRSDSAATPLNVLANDNIRPATAADWTITSVTNPTANVASPFLAGDILDPPAWAAKLAAHADPVSLFLWDSLTPAAQAVLANPAADAVQRLNTLLGALNDAVTGPSVFEPTRFAAITLRDATAGLLEENPLGEQLIVLNRLLLEDAYPLDLRRLSGGGNVVISGSQILYAPQPGFVGYERFTYRVSDGLGGTGFGEVIVRVGDISVSADSFAVLAGAGPVLLDVTANDGVLRDAFPAPSLPALADFQIAFERDIEIAPAHAGSAHVEDGLVSFTPQAGFSGPATLTYWVKDDSGELFPGIATVDVRAPGEDRDSDVVTVTVTGVNDAPLLLNAGPSATDDKSAVNPFANATVIEFDDQRQELVTLQITFPADRGVLSGAFTLIAPGTLEMTGTAAEITAALRALVFLPFIDRITVGTTEATEFTVGLTDHHIATPVVIHSAVTTVTPVNDPSVITGTLGGQKVYQYSSLQPFAGVNITDVDDLGLQPLTVTVQIDSAIKGNLSNLGGFTEISAGSGVYVFHGTPAASSAALQDLVFTPTPGSRVTALQPEMVGLSITVDDGFAPPLVDALTTVVVCHGEVDRLLALGATGQDASQAGANFGSSVAISGDTMAVGSPLRDTPANDAGRVFLYERNAGFGAPWGQVAELAGADTVAGDRFGHAVTLEGDMLVVGAPNADPAGVTNAGAVYVFLRDPANPNAWIQSAKLVASVSNSGGGDAFGTAVAIHGNTLLVGAPNANLPGAYRAGRVFAFQLGGGGSWSQPQILTAAINLASGTTVDGEFFGFSLALDGDTAVVGAHGANRGTNTDRWDYGAAYVFTRNGAGLPWSETQRLEEFTHPSAKAYDGFGYSVDISGDRIAVGVHSIGGFLSDPIDSGSARIYERNLANQWDLVRKITPADGARSIRFGSAVALAGDLMLVGSPGSTVGVTGNRGFVEAYRRNAGASPAWEPMDRFEPGSLAASDRFGHAVALDGFTGAVGAPGDAINALSAANAGSTRVYQFHYDPVAAAAPNLQDAYAAWSAARFSPAVVADSGLEADVWGMTADSDGDSYPNLIEMLLGTDPNQANGSQLTFQKLAASQVSLTFPLADGFPIAAVHVEWSANLTTWSRSGVTLTTHEDLSGDLWVTAVATPPTPQPQLFVRLVAGP